jgi:hypothetical protein
MTNNTNMTTKGNTGATDDDNDAEMKEVSSKNPQEEDTEMNEVKNNVESVSSSNKNDDMNENVTSINDATSMEAETKTEESREPEHRTTLKSLKNEVLPPINDGSYLFSTQDSTPSNFDKKIAEEIEAIMNGTHKDFIEKSNMLKQLMEERIAVAEKWRDIQIQNIINICNADIQQAQNDYNNEIQLLRERMLNLLMDKQKRGESAADANIYGMCMNEMSSIVSFLH